MKLYLSSLESMAFSSVRECEILSQHEFDTSKQCALVKLTPAVYGEPFGFHGDLDVFLIATRHEGESLFPIQSFPCFVHIAKSKIPEHALGEVVSAKDFQVIAWGELYQTRDDAENHVFDGDIN